MSPKAKKTPAVVTGLFRPGVPTEAMDVLTLYAIAARVVVPKPDAVGEVTQRLGAACQTLVPPDSVTAAECSRLWLLFVRLLRAAKPPMRVEAGKAFIRDLEAVGRKLELPPLPGWDGLPDGIDDPKAVELEWSDVKAQGETLAAVQERAKTRLEEVTKKHKGKEPAKLPATEVSQLIRSLLVEERDQWFVSLVGQGQLNRGDASLLVRWLAKGDKLTDDDEVLAEVFERLGEWLAKGG